MKWFRKKQEEQAAPPPEFPSRPRITNALLTVQRVEVFRIFRGGVQLRVVDPEGEEGIRTLLRGDAMRLVFTPQLGKEIDVAMDSLRDTRDENALLRELLSRFASRLNGQGLLTEGEQEHLSGLGVGYGSDVLYRD